MALAYGDHLCPMVSLCRPTPREVIVAQGNEGHDTGALGEVMAEEMVKETPFPTWVGPGHHV